MGDSALVGEVRARREARERAASERQSTADQRKLVEHTKKSGRAQNDTMRDVYQQGQTDERRRRSPAGASRGAPQRRAGRRPASVRPRAPWNPPRTLNAGDGAGFLLGLIAYAMGFAFLERGGAGVTGWLKAKFFGEVPTTPGPVTPLPGPKPGSLLIPGGRVPPGAPSPGP